MKQLCFALVVFLLLTGSSRDGGAQIPSTMSYQGVLVNPSGYIVPDGNYDITFQIYDVDTGGSSLWTEMQTTSVAKGRFNVVLGSNTPIALAFDVPYWLGITVDPDPEMSPRIELTGTPYAFSAKTVESVDAASILNGTGVANATRDNVFLASGLQTVLSRDITVPASGYVLAFATAEIVANHTDGTQDNVDAGISDDPGSLPTNQDALFNIPSNFPTSVHGVPAGFSGLFEVPSAGTYTYYFLAIEQSGDVRMDEIQLNLLYVPTAYGTVAPNAEAAPPADTFSMGGGLGSENPGVASKDEVSAMRRELESLRQRLAYLERRIAKSE